MIIASHNHYVSTRLSFSQGANRLSLGALEFAFLTKALRDVCENRSIGDSTLAAQVAAGLRRTLADIRAAETIDDLPFQHLIVASGDELTVRFSKNHCIRIRSNHLKPPIAAGRIDWHQVRWIIITEIGECDD